MHNENNTPHGYQPMLERLEARKEMAIICLDFGTAFATQELIDAIKEKMHNV